MNKYIWHDCKGNSGLQVLNILVPQIQDSYHKPNLSVGHGGKSSVESDYHLEINGKVSCRYVVTLEEDFFIMMDKSDIIPL